MRDLRSSPDASVPAAWPRDAVRNRLIGDWYIYQRTGGHRTSTDDLITAWYAVHRNRGSQARYLDLGSGVGSVLLMVCHKLRPAFALGVEAQEQSIMMAARSVAELPDHRSEIELLHADFRELAIARERFDLITGSPPYFPIDAGVLPSDPQRRACRFEERGGVEAYVQTAARALSKDGRFYLVFQTRWNERVTAAAASAGLCVSGRADFWARADRAQPFLSVFELARKTVAVPHRFQCAVRDADGAISAAYQNLRMELGVADRLSHD